MKKLKTILTLVLVSMAMLFIPSSYILTSAEETSSVESESSEKTTYKLYVPTNEYKWCLITLVDPFNCTLNFYETDDYLLPKDSATGTYRLYKDEIEISSLCEVVKFTINDDNTLTQCLDEEDVTNIESAEDTSSSELVTADTEKNDWFNETAMPILINYFAPFLGTGTMLLLALSKVISALKGVNGSKESLETAKASLTEAKDSLAKANEETSKQFETVSKDVEELKGLLNTLLTVEKTAYINNPSMVQNGTARKIAELVNEVSSNAEKEVQNEKDEKTDVNEE